MARVKLLDGTFTPTQATALPAILELVGKLVPVRTAVESMGLDYDSFERLIERKPALRTEFRMRRAKAMIEMQEKMIQGNKGWQAQFRLAESLEPTVWIKQSPATAAGRPKQDKSPYAASVRKR